MAIFNGVTLPDLPNYDKNKYPYISIMHMSSNGSSLSYLLLNSEPICYNPSTSQFENIYPREGATYQYPNSVGEEWLLIAEGAEEEPQEGADASISMTTISTILWANFDILNKETGEVVLKSYNGVFLPPLPSDIDRTVYLYTYVIKAYMSEYDYTSYMFMVADTPMEQNSNDYYILAGTKGVIGSINTTFDAWENVAEMGEVTTDTLLTDALQADGITLTVIWSEVAEEKLYSIKESTLKNIGNSIRAKTGKTELIPPENMPSEIDGISSGGIENGHNVMFYDENSEKLAFYSIKQEHAINPPTYKCNAWQTIDGEKIVFPYTPTEDIDLYAVVSQAVARLYSHYGIDKAIYPYVGVMLYSSRVYLMFAKSYGHYSAGGGITFYGTRFTSAVATPTTEQKADMEQLVEFVIQNITTLDEEVEKNDVMAQSSFTVYTNFEKPTYASGFGGYYRLDE